MNDFAAIEVTETAPAPDRLTPEFAAEVRRNLRWVLFAAVGAAALLGGLLGLAVDPSLGGGGAGLVGLLVSAAFLAVAAPMAGAVLALVYLFDCWPALLGKRFVRERLGVAPEFLSADGRRQAMKLRGFWAAFARGAVVGWAFAALALLVAYGATGRASFVGPAGVLTILAGNLSAQAWCVRRAIGAGVPGEAGGVGPQLRAKVG